MKPKTLAAELKVSDIQILQAAVQLEMVGIGFKTDLSEDQTTAIRQHLLQVSTPQLSPTPEFTPPIIEQPQSSAIEQSPESTIGIVTTQQTALSNAMAASERQKTHTIETGFQQASDDGFKLGVLTAIVSAKSRIEGAMLVQDAVFGQEQASRDRLTELITDSTGDDFLSRSQQSAKTYANTVRAGASTSLDVHRALTNLGVKI